MIKKGFDDQLTSVELAKKIAEITCNSTTGVVSFALGSLAEMNVAKSQIVINEDVKYVLNSIEDEIFHEYCIKEQINKKITEFESVIHSGSFNVNPTFVRLWISAKSDKQTLVQIYIATKEDLTDDDKNNSAIEEIKKRFKWTFGF